MSIPPTHAPQTRQTWTSAQRPPADNQRHLASGSSQAAGYINDVAVFNYALTAAQITNEYQGILAAVTVNPNPTNTVASISGGQLTLSWPSDDTGRRSQAQTNNLFEGITTNRVDVADSGSTNRIVIPIIPASGCVFYRLVYP